MGDRADGRRRWAQLLGGGGLVLTLVLAGAIPRLHRAQALESAMAADSAAGVGVRVARVKRSETATSLSLTGSVSALHEAELYARSNGYVRRWRADLGARVRRGDLLAEIETPELDHELDEARADLARERSGLALTKRNLVRWRSLAQENAVSKQELDERQAGFEDASARVDAASQNVRRLTALKGFAQIVAPFSGVITARNLDIGTLVAPGAGAGARGLYSLAQIDTVRLFVSVPQASVTSVAPGQPADVGVAEVGPRAFRGIVTRTANALDPVSRTLRVEIRVPNPDGALLPGMYAEVRFELKRANPPLVVPASTIVVRADGPQVGVVEGRQVHFRPVTLGRDYGSEVELLSGVPDSAELVLNPSDDIIEGAHVRVARLPPATDGYPDNDLTLSSVVVY
jgi:membrane fusion protein, multidrug efflux system